MSHARPRSGVAIAQQLGLPLDVYYQSVIFRANLIDGAGFTAELCGGNPSGAAFRIYGQRFLFSVHVSADSLSVIVRAQVATSLCLTLFALEASRSRGKGL